MLTMKDLHAGRLLVEFGQAERESVRVTLLSMRDGPPGPGLLERLTRRGVIDASQRQRAESFVARQHLLRSEGAYIELLKAKRPLPAAILEQAKEAQKREDYRRRIGEMLVQGGQLTAAQDEFLMRATEESLRDTESKLLQTYTGDDFQRLLPQAQGGAQRMTASKLRLSEVLSRAEMKDVLQEAEDAVPPEGLFASAELPPMPVAPPSPVGLFTSAEAPPPLLHSPPAPGFPPASPAPPPPPLGRPAPVSPVAPAPSGERFGDFELIKKLGEGGNGIVYLARQPDGEECALKVVRRGGGPDTLERFKREILATSFFDHENVIQIYDAGEVQGSYYMAMEVVHGEELRDLLNRKGRLPIRRALAILKQVLSGIGAAHRARIVHRDLKPENFMIVRKGDEDFVKVMDFGIARILDKAQEFSDQIFTTMQGKLSGSPKYLAPESITEPEIDERADLYSLGIILFEMVTGELPLRAPSAMKYLQEHLYSTPKTIAEVAPELPHPESLQTLISRLLEKDPKSRYQNTKEVLAYISGMVLPDLDELGSAPAKPKPKGKAKGKGKSKGKRGREASDEADEASGEEPALAEKRGCFGRFFGRK